MFFCFWARSNSRVLLQAEDWNDTWFILSNHGDRRNFALYSTPIVRDNSAMIAAPAAEWTAVMPYDADVYLEVVLAFKSHLVLFERSVAALRRIRVVDLAEFPQKVTSKLIEHEEPVHTVLG